MKSYLFILTALMPFFLSFQMNLKALSNVLKEPGNFDDMLSSDYGYLTNFSSQMKAYGISEEHFKELFWEGAKKSLDFYHSPQYLKKSSVNRLIEEQLYMNLDLGHSIKKPRMYKANSSRAFNALNTFSGEWHGKWQAMEVHHLWLPVKETNRKLSNKFTLIGFQSCFTGDGFGWNYVVKKQNSVAILGFVYHFDAEGIITAKNPHYAFLDPGNTLIWVSDNHIYYEFICDTSHHNHTKHYVISGLHYEKLPNELRLIGQFQAVYLSENKWLPDFIEL